MSNEDTIYGYVREYLAKPDESCQCMWSMKGPKNTDIKLMECWMIDKYLIIIQKFKSGGLNTLVSIPSVHMADDRPILQAMIEKAQSLQDGRMKSLAECTN